MNQKKDATEKVAAPAKTEKAAKREEPVDIDAGEENGAAEGAKRGRGRPTKAAKAEFSAAKAAQKRAAPKSGRG